MNLSGMPSATPSEETVTNNGFYPDLPVCEFIQNYAIATPYGNNSNMTEQKLSLAIVLVNKDLTLYHATHWLGVNALATVPSDDVNGETVLVLLYKHAVFSLAKSLLLISSLGETHRDKGAVRSLGSIDSEQHWLKQSNEAICQMINSSKNLTVELI
jgi:hypothetical protein